ncbi:head maturation protease, ClpP-related, partial [Paenibacillus sp. TAF43_2]|uniref:head maturation protease, ClpP-related n=1 Tax=Paenibacillus sp. TAF43_2 TaxID=3233069 RepID=UPI003F9D5D7B
MPKVKKPFWSFKASDNGESGDLFIYSSISSYESWWGDVVTPKKFKEELDGLGDVKTINVFVNSGGGDVFAGQAIHSMLKRHKAKVVVHIDGLAASIASVIAMAGDVIRIPRNAMMMVHDPWTWGEGNAKDFRKMADDLDAIAESIIAAYEDKTGQTREKIVELMNAETWLSADEAVELGFADEIEQSKEVAASLKDGMLVLNGEQMDLAKFKNPPKLAFLHSKPAVAEQPAVADNHKPDPERTPK